MPVFRLSLDIALPLGLLLAAVALGIGLFAYRSTIPPVSRPRRTLLGLLRGAALAAIVLLLLSPVLVLVRTHKRAPALAVLLDASESMTIGEAGRRPADELAAVLQSSAYREAAASATLHTFVVGTRFRPAVPADSVSFNDPATNLSEALESLRRELRQTTLDGALLISDGIFTAGQHPRYAAGELPIPVYGITVGLESGLRDVTISGVAANEIVTTGVETPVRVDLRATALEGVRTEVQLLDGPVLLDRAALTLAGETRDFSVRLSYIPETPGARMLTVRVLPVDGEMTTANNTRTRPVRVVNDRAVVLILAGRPSPDIAAVRQTLAEDPSFLVRSFTQRTTGGFYEGEIPRSLLDSTDCVILLGFPAADSAGSPVNSIGSVLLARPVPLLFVTGQGLDHTRIGPIAGWLPVVTELPSELEQSVVFEPSPDQTGNPLLSSGASGMWVNLPPLLATATSYRPRAGAVVLGNGRTQGTEIRKPLLVVRTAGRARSMALLGYGLWRWRLMAQRSAGTAGFFADFLGTSIRWLIAGEESRPVRVDLATAELYQGEPVRFFGQVYDAALRPVDNARLQVRVRGQAGEFDLDLRSTGNGRYEASLEGVPAGSFTYVAEAEGNGTRYGEDRGTFVIGGISLELQDTRMDARTLSDIAAITGGASAVRSGADSLLSLLRSGPVFAEREDERTDTVDFRHWPYSLGVLLLMLSAEWVLRKRFGMV